MFSSTNLLTFKGTYFLHVQSSEPLRSLFCPQNRQQVPSKRVHIYTRLHGITSQTTTSTTHKYRKSHDFHTALIRLSPVLLVHWFSSGGVVTAGMCTCGRGRGRFMCTDLANVTSGTILKWV